MVLEEHFDRLGNLSIESTESMSRTASCEQADGVTSKKTNELLAHAVEYLGQIARDIALLTADVAAGSSRPLLSLPSRTHKLLKTPSPRLRHGAAPLDSSCCAFSLLRRPDAGSLMMASSS